mgnify:CR=1 FL=1
MIEWLIERFTSIIWTTHPYERQMLILLMWLRVSLVALAAITVWWWLTKWTFTRTLYKVLAMPVLAFLVALGSADFVEHYAKDIFFGYTDNPRVMAKGELECWTGPNNKEYLTLWEQHKFNVLFYYDGTKGIYRRAVWEGDPGSGKFGDR